MYKVYDRFDYSLADIMDALDGRPMTEKEMRHVILGVASDLKKLHSQGFIHCDVKPSNGLMRTLRRRGRARAAKAMRSTRR